MEKWVMSSAERQGVRFSYWPDWLSASRTQVRQLSRPFLPGKGTAAERVPRRGRQGCALPRRPSSGSPPLAPEKGPEPICSPCSLQTSPLAVRGRMMSKLPPTSQGEPAAVAPGARRSVARALRGRQSVWQPPWSSWQSGKTNYLCWAVFLC